MNEIVKLVKEQTKELNDLHLIKGQLLGLYEAQARIEKSCKILGRCIRTQIRRCQAKVKSKVTTTRTGL